MRKLRDFAGQDAIERESVIDNTWCGASGAADLGMVDPQEYAEDGRVFVQGRCRKCGDLVRSELLQKRAES